MLKNMKNGLIVALLVDIFLFDALLFIEVEMGEKINKVYSTVSFVKDSH